MAHCVYRISSIEDACHLLKELSAMGPSTLADLARCTNFTKNKIFRILETLIEEKFIEKREHKYYLGYGLAEICANYIHKLERTRDDANTKLENLKSLQGDC